MRYGKFFTEQTVDAEDIMATSDGGEYTDEVLRKLKFYPIETIGENTGNCRVSYTLVNDENGGHIEETYTIDESSVQVAQYSKLKILLAAQQAGFIEALVQFLNADLATKMIWDASNVIEDNELLAAYIPSIAEALNKTPEEIKTFLDENCIAE